MVREGKPALEKDRHTEDPGTGDTLRGWREFWEVSLLPLLPQVCLNLTCLGPQDCTAGSLLQV